MGKAFSYFYDGTNRGEAIVNKAMYIVYNEEAEAFTDLVEKLTDDTEHFKKEINTRSLFFLQWSKQQTERAKVLLMP